MAFIYFQDHSGVRKVYMKVACFRQVQMRLSSKLTADHVQNAFGDHMFIGRRQCWIFLQQCFSKIFQIYMMIVATIELYIEYWWPNGLISRLQWCQEQESES